MHIDFHRVGADFFPPLARQIDDLLLIHHPAGAGQENLQQRDFGGSPVAHAIRRVACVAQGANQAIGKGSSSATRIRMRKA